MIHLIVFLPLAGFLLAGLFSSTLGAKGCEYVTTGFLIVSAALSWIVFAGYWLGDGGLQQIVVARWIESGAMQAGWTFRVDALTAVMLVVVTTVSALVHLYSIGYMHHDPHRPRFFAYLSLFTFAMLMLVTADNLLQMFFGWEGVGLASYLLIGFWFKRPSANAAAIKAFVVNRVGDFGFALGIFGVYMLFGSVELSTIFAGAADFSATATDPGFTFLGWTLDRQDALTLTCLLLFMGAMGKSAQVPLHTWLPDAMEGPTPVSALIHAATMVTAGVFLVARMSPVFELAPVALAVVTFIGAFTAFFAATVGLVQNDIKRVIAYSTCSQLGYMFAALGVGAYGAAIFHLFTHAFFKALLFLGAGSVIHAVSDEQDMRRMGGLRHHIPRTYWMMVIGTLALTGFGVPFTVLGTAGFFSKDAIIESVFAGQNGFAGLAFALLVIAALFTSFYSWRLIFMTFHGRPRASHEVMDHVHESPPVMLVPLYVLAAGALFAGLLFYNVFLGHGTGGEAHATATEQHAPAGTVTAAAPDHAPAESAGAAVQHGGEVAPYNAFWDRALFAGPDNHVLDSFHDVPWLVKLSPFLMMALGFLAAWWLYIRQPGLPKQIARSQSGLYAFLLNKWYFDEAFDAMFVRPARALGRMLWKRGDGWLIDGFGPDGVAARVQDVSARVVRLQSGYLYHYAFAMLIGVAALLTWAMF